MEDDLEITVSGQLSVEINEPDLKKYEAELILLLGSEGHVSTIDREQVHEKWRMRGQYSDYEAVEEFTEGVRGMRINEIGDRLDIGYQIAGNLVTVLGNRTGSVIKLSSANSRYFHENDRRGLEVVLTQTGTNMYERINAAVTAHRLQINFKPIAK